MRKALKRWTSGSSGKAEKPKASPAKAANQSEVGSIRSFKIAGKPTDGGVHQAESGLSASASPANKGSAASHPLEGPASPAICSQMANSSMPADSAAGVETQLAQVAAAQDAKEDAISETRLEAEVPESKICAAEKAPSKPWKSSMMAGNVYFDTYNTADIQAVYESAAMALSTHEAEPQRAIVHSTCAMDDKLYEEHMHKAGLFNLQLKVKGATEEDLKLYPARLALTDAVKYLGWVNKKYDKLEQDFPDLTWNSVMTVELDIEASQAALHRLICSLYYRHIDLKASIFEDTIALAHFLQAPVLIDAAVAYLTAELIPNRPGACFLLGMRLYPEFGIEEKVLGFFRRLQWDGAVSQSMLRDFAIVLESCSDETALKLLFDLTKAPAFISPLQVASVVALLTAAKREKLLAGLKIDNLSMADIQSLLHWANNRQVNRAVLSDSPILWSLFYRHVSSSLLPLEHLKQHVGPKAGQMKLWDVPLAHISPNPGQYRTRRSGWLHLQGGYSFCMEAIFADDPHGYSWGLYCNPGRYHSFRPEHLIKMCVIQQNTAKPHIRYSADIKPDIVKREGMGMGFEHLLSQWAKDELMVWKKDGEPYLTLGLYVDLGNAPQQLASETTAAEHEATQSQDQPALDESLTMPTTQLLDGNEDIVLSFAQGIQACSEGDYEPLDSRIGAYPDGDPARHVKAASLYSQ